MPRHVHVPTRRLVHFGATAALAVSLAVAMAVPVFAQGRGNDTPPGNSGGGGGNSGGGNSGNAGNDNRGNSGNSGSGQSAAATPPPTRTASTSTTTTTAPTGTTATTTDDGKDKGKPDKDEKDGNHGGAMRDAAQEARENESGPGRGREISEAARSAIGKPEQAVVSASGLLASLVGMQALIVGPAGETLVTLTEDTRIKTREDSDATLADLTALLAEGPVSVRARGRIGGDGALVALRLEVRGEADDVTVTLDGVIDAVATSSFTLVTRAGTAPTGSTATTTTAPTGTTTTTTTAPTGTTATTTAPTGTTATTTVDGTYTIVVGAETTIRRNDVVATLAALRAGDEVEARGTLDGTSLTATRILADGPATSGSTATTTAPIGTTATTTR